MKPRSRAHNRIMSRRKALRKKRLDACISYGNEPFYNNLHQFSKNKIHCSCPLCASKRKSNSEKDWKIADRRSRDRLNASAAEYEE